MENYLKSCPFIGVMGNCLLAEKRKCEPELKKCTDLCYAYYYGLREGLEEKCLSEFERLKRDRTIAESDIYTFCNRVSKKDTPGEGGEREEA